jgi:hypothetical protein
MCCWRILQVSGRLVVLALAWDSTALGIPNPKIPWDIAEN